MASVVGLLAADLAAWLLCTSVVFVVRSLIWETTPLFSPISLAVIGWITFRFGSGLYPPTGLSQPEELRLSTYTTAGAALIHFAMLMSVGDHDPELLIGLVLWVLLVPTAYLFRSLMRGALLRLRLFGEPCIVIGTGEKAKRAIREIQAHPELGLVPVGVFGDVAGLNQAELQGVPILGPTEAASRYRFPYRVNRALVALSRSEADAKRLAQLMEELAKPYPALQVLADLASPTNLLVTPRPVGPYLSLEFQHQRFSRRQKIVKRIFDLAVAGPVFLASLPFIGIAAILVKIYDPAGPVFFSQNREGAGGKPIRIWKIRTMVVGAERRLAEHLATNAAARFEYERTLKLRDDPRIIPKVGKYLRRYSVDELPQLWSIIKGDMSLVGPRVMLGHEVERFSEKARELRRDVPPGLTGFWQVMYRNNSDLQIWEVADSYYVNNWSIWLDGWIVLRTVRTVLTGAGAY
jgi:Undecaprenyl-phosphate galactose phosphotransferase WbaP